MGAGGEYKWNLDYVRGFPVREKAEPKPQTATPDDKVLKLQARRKRWTTKMKRAETAIKKIDKALRYYERKAAQPEAQREAA
jgi:hypothetical protein